MSSGHGERSLVLSGTQETAEGHGAIDPPGRAIGLFEHCIVRTGCRRLNCRTTSMGRYNKLLESLMTENRMDDRLDKVLEEIANDKPTAAQQRRIDILD